MTHVVSLKYRRMNSFSLSLSLSLQLNYIDAYIDLILTMCNYPAQFYGTIEINLIQVTFEFLSAVMLWTT